MWVSSQPGHTRRSAINIVRSWSRLKKGSVTGGYYWYSQKCVRMDYAPCACLHRQRRRGPSGSVQGITKIGATHREKKFELYDEVTAGILGAHLTIRYDQKIESKSYPTDPMPAANDALQLNRTRMVLAERALIDIARANCNSNDS